MADNSRDIRTDLFDLAPCSATIGAEISGIDLRAPTSPELKDALYQALLDWKVLFFRDQDITTEQHMAFARCFGELEIHPFAPKKDGAPEILPITHGPDNPGKENTWHSDVTWRKEPSLGSILRMIDGPGHGGDTLFADMYAAFEGLPKDVRDKVAGLTARHDIGRFRERLIAKGKTPEEMKVIEEKYANPHHPVIRTHPDTRRKAIYVNRAFTQEIDGMDAAESRELLELLYNQANIPEYQVRFRWQKNSIAFWDNRSCQHYAVSDYWPNERQVERATIIGDVPFFDPDGPAVDYANRPFRGRQTRKE